MNWKFWQKAENHSTAAANQTNGKGDRPRELPQQVGQYLVVREKLDPDWVWKLKCVRRERGQGKAAFDFRVFSHQNANLAGVTVRDYASLDLYPEQILYFGWYNKYSHEIELHSGVPEKAA